MSLRGGNFHLHRPDGAVTSSLEYQGYTQAAQDADGTWSTYFYDDWARHWKTTDGRNNSTEYVFAANDSIFTIKAPSSGASGTDDTVRTFDTLGRVATETKPGAGATTYTYDAAGRLAQQPGALTYTSSYGYDLTGRMTSRTKL